MGLPQEKKDKLSEKVAGEIHKDWNDRVNDLKKHEVGSKDATDIVYEGIVKAAKRWAVDRTKDVNRAKERP